MSDQFILQKVPEIVFVAVSSKIGIHVDLNIYYGRVLQLILHQSGAQHFVEKRGLQRAVGSLKNHQNPSSRN